MCGRWKLGLSPGLGDLTVGWSADRPSFIRRELKFLRPIQTVLTKRPAILARYDMNRSSGANGDAVTTEDLLRLVHLLNGMNATQPFMGMTVAACPP
jgi:hypothetical protein